MKKKIFCTIVISIVMMGCMSRYGQFYNYKPRTYWGCNLQIDKDSTFRWRFWTEWYSRHSFGTWTPVPNKKNHLLLKSSSLDYTHIPIFVRESHKEQTGATIIFSQGKQFYNCEFNEVLINGKTIPIDKDTIAINCHVDSLCVRLGYSEEERERRPWVLYNIVCTDTYLNHDAQNNVFEISLPEYPSYKDERRRTPTATSLFEYLPMETKAYYCCGKWYVGEKKIPYKRLKEHKKKE